MTLIIELHDIKSEVSSKRIEWGALWWDFNLKMYIYFFLRENKKRESLLNETPKRTSSTSIGRTVSKVKQTKRQTNKNY